MARARKKPEVVATPDAARAGALPEGVVRVLKWVTAASTVLALAFALVQATSLLSGRRETARRVREQVQVARGQLEARDYPAAWASATAAAEADARAPDVRRVQEDVAMAWIRNGSVATTSAGEPVGGGPRSFTEMVAPLTPMLDRGALEATGARKADLLAHRGWADFLRGRDGRTGDPVRFYRAAVDADARNPFAHAMWGHWLLWSGGDRREALDHFAAAAAAGRERAWVRQLQLAALQNGGTSEDGAETLRVANAVRMEGGTLDAGTRRRIHAMYWTWMDRPTDRARLLAALAPDAHLATYHWLFDDDLRDSTREASYALHLAQIEEHAGDSALALARFHRLDASARALGLRERAVVDSALARARRR